MARVLNFGSASFKSICSHCFWPVVEPSDMNWKLVRKATSVCSEKIPLFRLYFTYYAQTEIGFTLGMWILQCKMWENFQSCPKRYFERKQKKWPAASQRKPLFHRRHVPKRSWHKRTRLKLIFLEEDCSFFSLAYYSWEVGKECRKLTFMGSTCCLAQSLHRPLLPSEVHYLLKVWGVFQFR